MSLNSLSIHFCVFDFCAGNNVSISLRNNANKSGDTFSPCIDPTCVSKNSDCVFYNIALLIESNALL